MKSIWILTTEAPDNEQMVDRANLISEGTFGGQYENIRLVDEFRNAGFNTLIMDPSKMNITHSDALPDIALIRTTNGPSIKTLNSLKKMNIMCVNNIDAHIKCADKPKQLELLSKIVDIPNTKIIDLPFDHDIFDDIIFPVVVKPISSQRGELVKLCHSIDDVYIHCKAIRHRFSYQRKVIMQEFINGPTIVAWVIDRKPVSAQIRWSIKNDEFFVSNYRDDAIREAYPINNDLHDMIVNAVNTLNLDIAKIDILKSSHGYKICEVNSPGGFSGRDHYFGSNHAKDIVSYIDRMIR
jgi:gamma-F420-2:alpha-L-glutamate ligase